MGTPLDQLSLAQRFRARLMSKEDRVLREAGIVDVATGALTKGGKYLVNAFLLEQFKDELAAYATEVLEEKKAKEKKSK
jgi:hypothetical protein